MSKCALKEAIEILMKPENYKPDPEDFTKIVYEEQRVPRQIVAAANKYGDLIIMGVRHFCPLMCQTLDAHGLCGMKEEHEQGFVDQYGLFITRKEAKIIAETNDQWLREPFCSEEAFSENFW
jgi:hypothetical protein